MWKLPKDILLHIAINIKKEKYAVKFDQLVLGCTVLNIICAHCNHFQRLTRDLR